MFELKTKRRSPGMSRGSGMRQLRGVRGQLIGVKPTEAEWSRRTSVENTAVGL